MTLGISERLGGLVCTLSLAAVWAAPKSDAALDRQFQQTVRPFVNKYCAACHSGASPAAQFDLKAYTTLASVVEDHARWALVIDKLTAQQMPPASMPQPPAKDRQQVIDWVRAVRDHEARRNAGDPGPVLARRLSNAEYNYTIRDLTGVEIQAASDYTLSS